MADNNHWEVEGFLGKFPREGEGKAGKWMIQSISVYSGKDKATQKAKYEYVGFFVPQDDIDKFKELPEGTILRLTGKPEVNAYIDKQGEIQKKLQIKLDWEDSWQVVEKQKPEPALPGLEDISDDPF